MAANIQAYLENIRKPWGQIYYDILFDQLQDIKGKRQETEELTEGKVQTRGAEHVPLSCGRQYTSLRIWANGDLVM